MTADVGNARTAVSLNSSGRGYGQRGRDQRCVYVRACAHVRRFMCSFTVGSFGPAPFSIPKFMLNAAFMQEGSGA